MPGTPERVLLFPAPAPVPLLRYGPLTATIAAVLTVGVDIVEIDRIAHAIDRFGDRFLKRIYTDRELAFCRGRVPELAARFAGKEATMKALGTGVRGVSWRDIEILPRRGGKPLVYLHDRGLARADAMGTREFAISLTHSADFAIAVVAADAPAP